MRVLAIIIFLVSLSTLSAQNRQLLYNVQELPQSLLSNPASVINFDKHIGIPLLSGFSVEVGSSGVSAYDLFRSDSDINTSIDIAIAELDNKDYFSLNQQLEILSFGWRSRKSEIYYSGGLYHEIDALIYFPKDIAVLAYRGNADYIDRAFNFSDLSFTAESLSVYHFGLQKEVNDSWQLGIRAKVYMSVANVNSIDNTGTFVTRSTPEGPNFYSHQLRNAKLGVNTSGIASLFDDEESTDVGEIASNAFLSDNVGFGIDLGFTHFLNDQWLLTGSLIDIGFINHKGDVRNFSATGDYDTSGIELEFPGAIQGVETTSYWQELEDEFEDAVILEDSLSNPYTSWRPLKINGSVQYSFGEDRGEACNCISKLKRSYNNRVGAHLYSIKRPRGFQTALTGYYEKQWGNKLLSRVTYTYDKRSSRNIGLLMSAKIDKFNLYLAADNLLEYTNLAKARGASLQLGMQLVFNNK
ncbi:DUF5723 family protein [uncultured Dokdonia sp.]|uniref:DUF5723 family protein n=1 Tax=uncultured Dokdonia sp. TaxID=575653 RepID=UPI0030ED0EB8|tara:strand:- start:27038 stop:28444 length:1407 start_codon:yes stop_codon:yes gene_type:complete